MTIKILMPALSPTMSEGALTKWLVKVGDQIKAGDILAEIETDKATMEVEAVDEGKVINLLVKEGTTSVQVNSPIKKVNSADVPMPYSSVLEKKYLPQVDDIILAIKQVCYI